MALDCQLDISSDVTAFTVTPFYYYTFFAQVRDDTVMPRDYQLGRGSSGAAFKINSLYGENSYA